MTSKKPILRFFNSRRIFFSKRSLNSYQKPKVGTIRLDSMVGTNEAVIDGTIGPVSLVGKN